jgi:hypothetical protein
MATLHCGPASCDTSSVKHRFLQMLIETRAADAGDPATNPRGWRISRWAVSADVGHCSTPPCGGYRQSGQWASLKRADQCSEERFTGYPQATQSQATALYTDVYHLWLRITPGMSAWRLEFKAPSFAKDREREGRLAVPICLTMPQFHASSV